MGNENEKRTVRLGGILSYYREKTTIDTWFANEYELASGSKEDLSPAIMKDRQTQRGLDGVQRAN